MAPSQKGNRACDDFRLSGFSESADKSAKDLRTDSRSDNQLHCEDARERVFVRAHRQYVPGTRVVHELYRESDSARPPEETKDDDQEHIDRGGSNIADRCIEKYQGKIDSIFASILRYQEQGALQLARDRRKPRRKYDQSHPGERNERPIDQHKWRLLENSNRLREPISKDRRRLDVYNAKRGPQVQSKRFEKASSFTCQARENKQESLSSLTPPQFSHESAEAWCQSLHDKGTIRSRISGNDSHIFEDVPTEHPESISNVRTKLSINNFQTYESKSMVVRQNDTEENRKRSPYLRHCGGWNRGVRIRGGARHLQSGLGRLDCLGSSYVN